MKPWQRELSRLLAEARWDPESFQVPRGIVPEPLPSGIVPPKRTEPLTVTIPGLSIETVNRVCCRVNAVKCCGCPAGHLLVVWAHGDPGQDIKLSFSARSIPWNHFPTINGGWKATDPAVFEAADFEAIGD